MRPLIPLLLLSLAADALAATFYVTPDTPADLAGTTFTASEIVRTSDATYQLEQALPTGARIDALQRMASGSWLFSLETTTTIGATTYDPRDVVRFDGANYVLHFNGAANGIPAGVNVDAIALGGSDAGPLFLSVDVPARIGAIDVDPSDVLQFQAGVFTLVFDGSATTPPIPPDSNVIGLDRLANRWLLSFDVPTTLGSLTAIPGDIVGWNGSEFGLQRSGTDTAWPLRNELTALSSLPGGGTSDRLRVQRSGNQLRLSWDPSCSLWANDYAIYAGTIGAFNSHTAIDCSDDLHDLTETIALPAGNRYYLVVPLTANAEGSYGATSAGVERPRGTAVCRAAQTPPSCP